MNKVYEFRPQEADYSAGVTAFKPNQILYSNNIRREGSRYFRKKKKVYLKSKLMSLNVIVRSKKSEAL